MFFLGVVISYRKPDPLLYTKPCGVLLLDSVNDSNASLYTKYRELKVILVNSWPSKFSRSWGYKNENLKLIFPLESPKDQVLMTWTSNPKHIRAVCNQKTKPQQLYNSSIGSNGEVLLPHRASRLHSSSSIISSYSSHDAPCGMQYNVA
jgi:hypothetical protein